MRRCAIGFLALAGCGLIPLPALATNLQFEPMAASDSSFARPHDVVLAPDGRHLYVADNGNDVVKVLDPETLAILGEIGGGTMVGPHDVAFDAAGNLLVADSGNDRILVYRVDGLAAAEIAVHDTGLASPEGVTTIGKGRVVVSNTGSDDVVILDAGRVVARSSVGDGLSRPHDIQVGPGGALYLADSGHDRIVVLNDKLQATEVLSKAMFGFYQPKYLAFGPAGRLYVADEYNHRVLVIAGRRLLAVIGPEIGKLGRLNKPEGVTVVGGRLWIADTYNNRILRFRVR